MNNKTTPADDIWKDELSYDEYIEKRLDEIQTAPPVPPVPFPTSQKFNEDQYLDEIRDYLAGTYKAHYATGSVQAFELIDSAGLSEGFTMGSVIKYASRYGKKNGHNRKDLMKIIHYALLQLWVHDQTHQKQGTYNG
jgi:hypothetical protein